MVIIALCPDECCLIAAHDASSGFHVCAVACSGVSDGNLLVSETQRGSIAPIFIGSPPELASKAFDPSAYSISMRQLFAAVLSCQMKVGEVIS